MNYRTLLKYCLESHGKALCSTKWCIVQKIISFVVVVVVIIIVSFFRERYGKQKTKSPEKIMSRSRHIMSFGNKV